MISSTEATWSKSSLNTLHMAYNMYVLLLGIQPVREHIFVTEGHGFPRRVLK